MVGVGGIKKTDRAQNSKLTLHIYTKRGIEFTKFEHNRLVVRRMEFFNADGRIGL